MGKLLVVIPHYLLLIIDINYHTDGIVLTTVANKDEIRVPYKFLHNFLLEILVTEISPSVKLSATS